MGPNIHSRGSVYASDVHLLWTKLCHITGVDTFEQYPELRTAL